MARVLRLGAQRPWRTVALVVVAYLLVWTGLDWVAYRFPAAPGVSLWYAPAALDVALLLLLGLRWSPLLAVTVVIHSVVIARVGLGVLQVAVLAAVTVATYAGAAALLVRRIGFDTRLSTQRDVSRLILVMCIAAPLPMTVVQVGLLQGVGAVRPDEFVTGVVGYWAGATTGIAMLVPVLFIAARSLPRIGSPESGELVGRPGHQPGRVERAAQVTVLAAAVFLGFAINGGSLDYSYLVYAPLIWISLRGGFVPAALAVLAVNVAAVAFNRGQVPADGGFALQFGLVTLTLLGVMLGAAVTQRQRDAETDRVASLHDPLTGLANRALLGDRLAQVLHRRATRSTGSRSSLGGLLFVDLDEFKQINDSLSHAAGDQVLTEVGRRLGSVTRATDTVARLGGDEFAVLLDDLEQGSAIDLTAERILAAVSAPIQIDGGLVHVTASIGSASLPVTPGSTHQELTTAALLHHADVALHQAKDAGRNRHVGFQPEHLEHARRRRDRADALRLALDADEITAVFQPVIRAADGRVVAAEALARWQDPDGRSVPPEEFVAVAEASGLIARLGESMLRQACTAAMGWEQDLRVAVNVSALELHRDDYADTVLRILEQTGLPAGRLELEVTETQWVNDAVVSSQALTTLVDAGVSVVLDDFGTGYSSFRHLADMPVSGLKVDRSFIASLTTDRRSAEVVRAILCTAHELGLSSTAEGVETQEQLDFLVRHGCTQAQGYLIGRPSREPPGSRPGTP